MFALARHQTQSARTPTVPYLSNSVSLLIVVRRSSPDAGALDVLLVCCRTRASPTSTKQILFICSTPVHGQTVGITPRVWRPSQSLGVRSAIEENIGKSFEWCQSCTLIFKKNKIVLAFAQAYAPAINSPASEWHCSSGWRLTI